MSSDAVSEADPFQQACEALVERIVDGKVDREDL